MTAPYTPTGNPVTLHRGISSEIRNEFILVQNGFNTFPAPETVPNYAADTGAANAYVVTLTPVPTGYTTGMQITFKAVNANTTASTINVNALGAKTIKRGDGTDLQADDIYAGQLVPIMYDGTYFQLVQNALSAATAAGASAAAAASSASTASTQAGNAASSASAASTSASNASTSESNASGSATLASQWATSPSIVAATDYSAKQWATKLTTTVDGSSYSAKQYAANAAADAILTAADVASSGTNAGTATTQAGIATTQAGIATTQAGIATTQAGNAASSASAASGSASGASASASTASTQAGIATTQASNASSSATLASLWATSGVIVAGTDYSAKQWATKATTKVDATYYSAYQYALNAAASAASIGFTLATSNTWTNNNAHSDYQISRAMLLDCGYTVVDKGNSSTTTQTYDYTASSYQTSTATGNHTIAFSNWPPTGNTGYIHVVLTNGGAYTLTMPTVNWLKPDGTTTTTFSTYLAANTGRTALQTSGVDQFLFWTRDAGTTVYGKLL